MKIKQISLENFRCFRRAQIDLSADIVAIYGRNGVGKTTIFDAVEFALLDNIGRFLSERESPDYLPNVFSDDRLLVRVDFTGNTNSTDDAKGWIERTLGREPKAESLITSSGGWKNTNDLLFGLLVDERYLPPRREVKVIAELFRATALLSQDLIKNFIEGESEERARILSCISGSAYWQRCLDKAKDVMPEAEKRKKQEETELKSIQAKAGELKQNMVEREARIKTIRERIGAEAGSYDFLLKKLKEAGISVEHMPPQTTKEEGSFLADIRGICQERVVAANTRSKQLAELEAIVQQHPERLDRRRKLMEMIDKAKKDLGELLKKHEESNESLKEANQKISKLDGIILAQSNRFRALQGLLDLKLQKTGLIKMRDTGLTEIERIRRDLNEVKVGIEKEQAGLEGKKQEITGLQLSVTQISRTLDKLNSVKVSILTYKNLKVKISRTELQIQQLEKKREALDKQIKEAQKQYINSNNKVAEMSKTVSAMKASSKEEEDLIVRLRRFAGDNICPLCGHIHATPDALKDAIAARLNNVSTAFQEAVEQLQNETLELTKIKSEIVSYEQELKETDDALQKLRAEREEVLTLASTIEEDSASAWTEAITARLLGSGTSSISPRFQDVANVGKEILIKAEADSGKALNSLINHSRTTLLEHRNSLQQTEDRAKETEARLSDGKVKADSLQEALDKQQKAYQEVQQKQIFLDRRIIELGLTNESQLPKDHISQLIETARTLLVDQEEKKANQKNQRDKLQSELDAIIAERMKVESSLKEWEQILSRVISEIEDFRFKAKSFGLAGDASAEVINKARIHLSRKKDRLDAAQRAAERYEATYNITLLEKERNEFYRLLEEIKRDEQGSKEQLKKIDAAVDEIQKWISSLTESVNQAVEAKINGHQMEIIRLFRAMIPSPYLFDKVSMRKSETGLELGLRYSGLKQDAGEPRFFLSSAQANILALSIFLSLAGRQQWSKLETVLLDDPVQHLDDLDAVSFLDYLRAAALGNFCPRKQIIVSTCDQNLYLLMLRKFSLLESAGLRFMGISLLENGKKGAQIHYDVGGPEGMSYVAEVG